MTRLCPLAALLFGCAAFAQSSDTLLRAMHDELDRSRNLRVLSQEAPYFIEYSIEDTDSYEITGTLGGLVGVRHNRFRIPQIQVRVGDYAFDDTDYAGSGMHFGSHYDVDRFPLEDDYGVLRRFLWLGTDSAYKSAVEALSRKRAALKNVADSEKINDFAKAAPVRKVEEIRRRPFNEDAWAARVRGLSGIFNDFPGLTASSVDMVAHQTTNYYANSEGTETRTPETMIFVMARAEAQASDGMLVHDAARFESPDLDGLPGEPEIQRGLAALATHVTDLSKAPKGEDYAGPVLFDGVAAAQIFAEVLGRNLALTRRPVMEPGRSGFVAESEFEGRQGVRVMPESFDVVDDPTQKEWQGRKLFGSYDVDLEGVVPAPLALVEHGVLKTFLLTRQPMHGFEGSNGRARMPGSFGADAAGISNLFVRSTQTTSAADLKNKLIEMCKQRNKPYGIIVRKMDFPSSASFDEVRRSLGNNGQSGGHPVSSPILVYRVYPDGREQLVRGLRFRSLNARSLKDILAAGDDANVFNFLNSQAPFALIGASTYVAETSVVAPSVLIDDVELHPIEEEMPKLPIVPPPGRSH